MTEQQMGPDDGYDTMDDGSAFDRADWNAWLARQTWTDYKEGSIV